MAVVQLKKEPRTKALDKVVRAIQEHNFTWDELHQAVLRVQAEKLIPTVREVIAGREFEYKRLGEYVIAMHKLCGGLPVVKYKDETGATVLTRINAGVILGYLEKGWTPEEVAADFHIPVEPVREVGELATLFDYDRSYA
jgi:uncharacterized protein (DUF433 family)